MEALAVRCATPPHSSPRASATPSARRTRAKRTMLSVSTNAAASVRGLRLRATKALRGGKPATRSVTLRRGAIVSDETIVGGKSGAEYDEFASLLDKYQYNYKVGDVITGRVKACDAKGAWVEIGAKSEALCPTSEASLGSIRNVR